MIILIQAGWQKTKQLDYTKYYDPQMYEREKTGAKYNPSFDDELSKWTLNDKNMSHDLKSKGLAIEALRRKLYLNLF